MQEFFTQGIRYKIFSKERLEDTFMDEIYLKTRQTVDILLSKYNLIDIVSNEKARDRIPNITVLTKDHKSFYSYSEPF